MVDSKKDSYRDAHDHSPIIKNHPLGERAFRLKYFPDLEAMPKPLNSYGHTNLHDKESKR